MSEDEEQSPSSLTEIFLNLQKETVKCGINPKDFWDYTLYEIQLIVNNYVEVETNRTKEELALTYNTAVLITTFVSRGLSGKQIPSLQDTYPDLFAAVVIPEEENNKSLDLYKEQFLDFANAHNRKLRNKQ